MVVDQKRLTNLLGVLQVLIGIGAIPAGLLLIILIQVGR